jgi:hypothetical protein
MASYAGPGVPPPAFNPVTWALGYQSRQVGAAGPSVFEALATPPTNMGLAVQNVLDAYTTGGTAEPFPAEEQ